MAVPTPKMYLEGTRFQSAHIRHLNDDGDADAGHEGGGEDNDDNKTAL